MSEKSKEKKSVRKVVSIMSRHLVKEGQLEFQRGEIFLVIQDNGAWLNVINETTGDQGLIPSNYCAPGEFDLSTGVREGLPQLLTCYSSGFINGDGLVS